MTKDSALRMALDFIERTSSYLPTSFDSDGMKIHAMLKEALAQPEQEPVAWIYSQGAAKVVSMNYVAGVRASPLYTTPPQRTWVGLTSVDWNDFNAVKSNDPQYVAAWAETKLKEKNA